MSPRQVVQKVANVLTILAFFAALWLVWAARLLHRGESPCPNENRLLAAAPDFRATPLAELPKKIEAYVQDHLPYRAEFIKCHTFLKHWCLGLRSESVVIGKDGFLFYDRDGCQTLDYMGQAPLHGRATRPVEVVSRAATGLPGCPQLPLPVRDRPQCGLRLSREAAGPYRSKPGNHAARATAPLSGRAIIDGRDTRPRPRPPRRKTPRPDVLSG